MLKRFLLAFAALLMLPAAASAETLAGSWALRIDETTIFRFDLQQASDGSWQGTWTRPRSYRNNGVIFSDLEGHYEATSRNGQAQGDAVRLTFDDPRPRSLPDTLRFRVTGEGMAQVTYVDTGFAPLPLVRVGVDTDIGPFAEGRLYDRDGAQSEPTRLANPTRATPAPQPAQELPAVAGPPPQRVVPARAAPAPRPQPAEELPALATPAPAPAPTTAPRPQPAQEVPARVAPNAPQAGAWQPDPSVAAAIAARAAALDGATAAPAAPAAPPPAPSAPQTDAWQPDPSVRAAIAARAAAVNGSVEPAEEPEAAPARPDSRLGADFLEGL